MTNTPPLPDLNQYPSVLETWQVNELLRKILDAVAKHPEITRNDAAGRMLDSIFARGYRPGESFDPELMDHIATWIVAEWPVADVDFAETAVSLLANLPCTNTLVTIEWILGIEQRQTIRDELTA